MNLPATSAGPGVLAAFRAGPPAALERPLVIVHGNCQAEALRRLLPEAAVSTVRIPPVHELDAADVVLLRRWLTRASALVTQPIRRGYRGLPVGTAEVIAAAAPGTRVVLVPVVRYAGLYPEQAIVRPPDDPSAVPPLVAYHSLRTLAEAAGRVLRPLRPAAVREIAAGSLAELADRERRHGTVVVSDLLGAPRFSMMRTINHPGNRLWAGLAGRVCAALGLGGDVPEPAHELLDSVRAPRRAAVIEAFGLAETPVGHWTVDGEPVDDAAVHAAHLRWYADRPGTVAAGMTRHRAALAAIGLR